MDDQNHIVGVIDKVAEARFFLCKLEASTDFAECAYYASAFGSACYSIVECLKRRSRDPKDACDWWRSVFDGLKASPMHRYFHDGRNDDIHEGNNLVSGIEVKISVVDSKVVGATSPLLKAGRPYSPGKPAIECREYFISLLRVVLDGYRRFNGAWDPDRALASEFSIYEGELTPLH